MLGRLGTGGHQLPNHVRDRPAHRTTGFHTGEYFLPGDQRHEFTRLEEIAHFLAWAQVFVERRLEIQ